MGQQDGHGSSPRGVLSRLGIVSNRLEVSKEKATTWCRRSRQCGGLPFYLRRPRHPVRRPACGAPAARGPRTPPDPDLARRERDGM
jgi:hypothetical protein